MRTWQAVALGALAMATAPIAVPTMLAIARPFLKTVTKQALVAYEHARVRLIITAEELEDLIAEARAEAEQELASWRREREAAGAPSSAEMVQTANGPVTANKRP